MTLRDRLQYVLGNRYGIDDEVGRGGMAVVFGATDRKHGRRVAIKVFRPELSSVLGIDRFLHEIEVTARLQHPHIVPLHDSGSADGLLYFIMPLVVGESLRARLERERHLSLEEAVQITKDVADALSHAHSHGVLHRDVKPENILLSGGHALVADFGVAGAVRAAAGSERLTQPGLAIGTPAYMSPEQASGREDLDGRSDLYALGCVLYEMLGGTAPGGAAGDVRADTPRPVRDLRTTVPVPVDRALRRALAPLPADRFPTVESFAEALGKTVAPAASSWRRVLWGSLGVAGILLFLLARPGHDPSYALDLNRIVVLPFEDLSPDADNRHIARGLTEALTDELSRVEALDVLSGGAAERAPAGTTHDSLAQALAAGTIVHGSVMREGDVIRVNLRLSDGRSGSQLYADAFRRRVTELFALQDTLAQEMARALRRRIGEEVRLRGRRERARSVAAWEAFQRAELWREDARRLTETDVELASALLGRADSAMAEAERLDPAWLDPVVQRGWLARQRALMAAIAAQGGRPAGPAGIWIAEALAHADRAAARRPDAPEVLELEGVLRLSAVLRGVGAEDSLLAIAEGRLLSAVRAAPRRARAWYSLSRVYELQGRFAESYVAAENAFQADAYLQEAEEVVNHLLFGALNLERYVAADRWCATARRRFPADPRFVDCELIVLGWHGAGPTAVRRAWETLQEIESADTAGADGSAGATRRLLVAAVLARSGHADSARAVTRRALSGLGSSERQAVAFEEAYVHTLLGDPGRAIEALAGFLQAAPQWRDYTRTVPWFASLHDDPRFRQLVEPD